MTDTGSGSDSGLPERYQRVRELVEAALDLPPTQREAYFEQAPDASDVIEEAMRIVAGSESAWSERLERPPIESILRLLAEASLRPGELLGGRYRIERKIGEGGFGEVYLARDTHLHGRAVAVKRLVASATVPEESFRIELEALAQLRHAGVVQVLDWGRAESGLYLVMEYVEGETLRQAMDGGALASAQRLEILRQVIEAVSAAHALGTAHCDLKPENILLRTEDKGALRAVVVDFGIARLAGIGQPRVRAGSRSYMAPEQAKGEGSARSDVFSLALIAEELLGTRQPAEMLETLERARSERPEDRFPNAKALGVGLARARTGAHRRRWMTGAATGGAAILAGGASWWVWRKWFIAPRDLPHTGPVSPGNLLFADLVSGKILELDARRRKWIQAIPLPPGYTLERQLVSVLVRRRDLGFLVNARKGRPVVLGFTREGHNAVSHLVEAEFYQQMAIDPNDPFEDTVMAGLQFSETVVAVNPYRGRVAPRCRGSNGDYIGLVLDAGQRIYASEYSTGEVRRFRRDGSFEGVFARLEPASVNALSIGPEGELYSAQHQKNQISVISASGEVIRVLRLPQFSGPAHVYVNPVDGLLYVGNIWNDRLIVADRGGKLVAEMHLHGSQLALGCVVPV